MRSERQYPNSWYNHSDRYFRCVFEKHRRGRKPGSKYVFSPPPSGLSVELEHFRLSEASKLLRRLEKGLNSAKPKSQSESAISSPYPISGSRNAASDATHYSGMMRADNYGSFNSHFPSIELPPLNLSQNQQRNGHPSSSRGSLGTLALDDEDEDNDHEEDSMFPAKLIKRENQRHSFFRTI